MSAIDASPLLIALEYQADLLLFLVCPNEDMAAIWQKTDILMVIVPVIAFANRLFGFCIYILTNGTGRCMTS